MVKTKRTARPSTSHPIELRDGEAYVPCRDCHRCTTGVGRDVVPGVSDCWGAHLDAAVLAPERRPA